MEVAEKRELTNKEHALLKGQAWYEKKTYNEVKVRCPKCNDIVDVELRGTSAITRCSCGYMNDSLRGI